MTDEPQATPPPGTALRQMIWGFTISQALHVTAKLGIIDVLRPGPLTSLQIAAAVGAHEPALRRLLRALTTVALLVEDENGRFAATPEGELLRADHPQSLRPWALFLGAPFVWRPWGALADAVMTGTPSFDHTFGEAFFAYLAHSPEDSVVFNAAMTSGSEGDLPAILAAYDFSGFGTIVDVGGGEGVFLRDILERYPQARGVLYDLPAVVATADVIRESAVAARCEMVGGDMFRAVPSGGDAYLLKSIIHDWNDPEALQILRNCREAIGAEGKILVVDGIIAPPNVPDFAKWVDLTMLVLLTGRERSEAEYRDLYAAAGFTLTRVIPMGAQAIIEGVPV